MIGRFYLAMPKLLSLRTEPLRLAVTPEEFIDPCVALKRAFLATGSIIGCDVYLSLEPFLNLDWLMMSGVQLVGRIWSPLMAFSVVSSSAAVFFESLLIIL